MSWTIFELPYLSGTMHAFITLGTAGLLLLAVRETCLIIYRLYFHPLASIPGPRLASATQWYEFYYDILRWPGGQYWSEIDKMHETYGRLPHNSESKFPLLDS